MKKREKYTPPLLAETEKKRFHRLLHERPVPYPDRPQGQYQYYQVWAWDDEVSRLIQHRIKKGSRLWITGRLQLVDCTSSHGKNKTKILKVYLSDFGFLPGPLPKGTSTDFPNDTETANVPSSPSMEILDGERESLPE